MGGLCAKRTSFPITQEMEEEIKRKFRLFDEDGSGSIDTRELKKAMTSLGYHPTDKEVADMIKSVDSNRSGKIELPEFRALMIEKMGSGDHDAELREAWKALDKYNRGYIVFEDLQKLMDDLHLGLSNEDVAAMWAEAATGADQKYIQYEDFVNVLMKP